MKKMGIPPRGVACPEDGKPVKTTSHRGGEGTGKTREGGTGWDGERARRATILWQTGRPEAAITVHKLCVIITTADVRCPIEAE